MSSSAKLNCLMCSGYQPSPQHIEQPSEHTPKDLTKEDKGFTSDVIKIKLQNVVNGQLCLYGLFSPF